MPASSAARSITPALAGIVAGTALQLQQPALWSVQVDAVIAGGALALLAVASRLTRPLAAFIACAALAFSFAGMRGAVFAAHALPAFLDGRDIDVTGVVGAMPQRTEAGLRFRFDVESASLEGQAIDFVPQLALGWYGGAWGQDGGAASVPDVRAGERWQLRARVKSPHGTVNPQGFDLELWMWEQGAQATAYVRTGRDDPAPRRLGSTWQAPVESARQWVRDLIVARVQDRRAAGLIAALVVGDQAAIDRADWDVYRATGVAHLMSISGLHITMFAWVASLAVGALWRRSARLCLAWPAPQAALLGGVALAAAYALFSGWGVPAQRTVLMLCTVSLLRFAGRRWPWPQVWLLACAVVLLADPWAMVQAGFWLSFVAVGVLFATGAGGAAQVADGGRGARVLAHLRSAAHEQLVVTLALAPLTLLLFGQVSVVGLVANAVAIPWVTLVLTPLAMTGVAVPPAWDAAAWCVGVLDRVLGALAALPFATFSVATAPVWAAACGVFGGVLVAMRLPWHLRAMGIPLLVPVLCWQVPRPAPGTFELLAADIGQGNAVLVRTATHALLYDAGPRYSIDSDAGHRVLVPLLQSLGERLDRVVLSHRDSDHTGGAAAVLAMQGQADLVSSLEDTHPLQAVRHAARCVAGQHWRWDGVDFSILQPEAGDYGAARKSNAMSCVLRIEAGGVAALLAGDIEAPQEARLVADHAPLAARVLLVPHHGSRTSSSAPFLDAVHPTVALVQAGWRNRFGHPAPPVVERLHERGIAIVDSPHCGAARWSSSAPDAVHCERQEHPRYWRHVVP